MMNARTGRAMSRLAHIHQSLADILTTPIGSRIMRRDDGSEVPELIDQPLNGAAVLRIYAASQAIANGQLQYGYTSSAKCRPTRAKPRRKRTTLWIQPVCAAESIRIRAPKIIKERRVDGSRELIRFFTHFTWYKFASLLSLSIATKVTKRSRASIYTNKTRMVELVLYISKESNKTLTRITSGYWRLDEVTVYALSGCKFKPVVLNEESIEAREKLKYVWQKNNDEK